MSEQQIDLNDMQALNQQLSDLITYCSALKEGASGFAYMLPNDWQGQAMNAFLGSFQTWAVGAEGMRLGADSLAQLAQAATEAYQQTVDQLDSSWTTIRSGLEG